MLPHLDFDTWAAALNLGSIGGTAPANDTSGDQAETKGKTASGHRIPPPGARPSGKNDYTDLRQRLLKDVMARLEPDFRLVKSPQARDRIETLINELLAEYNFILARAERSRLQDSIYAELCGYGPIDVLMEDKAVQAIFVNGPKNIFVEVRGQLSRSVVVFDDDEHVLHHIDRMVAPLGHFVDESYPMTTTRLADGSAVYCMLRPVSLVGPSITIRKPDFTVLSQDQWVLNGSLSREMLDYLRLGMLSGLSVLVTGGISAGKASLLNMLAGHLPNDCRIVTIERIARLLLGHEHVVPLEARQHHDYETADLRTSELVEVAGALRPDVLFFGSRMNDGGGERLFVSPKPPPAKQIIGCMDGNDAQDVIDRLEITGLQYGDGSSEMIHQRIAERLNVIIQVRRMRDGSRKITGIWEVDGRVEGRAAVYPLFRFEQIGMEMGKVIGRMVQVTPVSRFATRFKNHGFDLTPLDFDPFGSTSSSKR
ncbi:MAG: ATPase, T2SS/T4P/T4SS family [Anaerolineae bacterium]